MTMGGEVNSFMIAYLLQQYQKNSLFHYIDSAKIVNDDAQHKMDHAGGDYSDRIVKRINPTSFLP